MKTFGSLPEGSGLFLFIGQIPEGVFFAIRLTVIDMWKV